MESDKKLMEEIQTEENDFFDEFDKFACTQEVFDLIRKLPNFKLADPAVPESGYFNGKPNMYTVVKVLAGIIIPLMVGAILFALFTI